MESRIPGAQDKLQRDTAATTASGVKLIRALNKPHAEIRDLRLEVLRQLILDWNV